MQLQRQQRRDALGGDRVEVARRAVAEEHQPARGRRLARGAGQGHPVAAGARPREVGRDRGRGARDVGRGVDRERVGPAALEGHGPPQEPADRRRQRVQPAAGHRQLREVRLEHRGLALQLAAPVHEVADDPPLERRRVGRRRPGSPGSRPPPRPAPARRARRRARRAPAAAPRRRSGRASRRGPGRRPGSGRRPAARSRARSPGRRPPGRPAPGRGPAGSAPSPATAHRHRPAPAHRWTPRPAAPPRAGRGARPSHRGRSRRPAGRDEVVEQPPELAGRRRRSGPRGPPAARRPSGSSRPQTRRRGSQNVISRPTISSPNAVHTIPAPGSFFAISSVNSPNPRSSTEKSVPSDTADSPTVSASGSRPDDRRRAVRVRRPAP